MASQKFGIERPSRPGEARAVVEAGIAPHRRDHAERDRDTPSRSDGEDRQFQRNGQRAEQERADRLTTAERTAEVAVEHAADPA